MAEPRFNIGDQIIWKADNWDRAPDMFKGIVKEIHMDEQCYTILFKDDFAQRYKIPKLYKGFTFKDELTFDKTAMTIEEQVQHKCKLLWNNSKYVKTNPKLGY